MDIQKQHGSNVKALKDRDGILLFFTTGIIGFCARHQNPIDLQIMNFVKRWMISAGGRGNRKLKSKRNSQKISTLPEYFLCEIDSIKSTCATLLTILNAQGLKHGEIRQFIGNVIHIVEYGGIFKVASVNHALESLGWPKQLINEISFELT